jgi:hypothetical protein
MKRGLRQGGEGRDYGARLRGRLARWGLGVAAVALALAGVYYLLNDNCLLPWSPRGRVTLIERAFVRGGRADPCPYGEHFVSTADVEALRVRLGLKPRCVCARRGGRPEADVITLTPREGNWASVPEAQMQLAPLNGDVSVLQGEWLPFAGAPRRKLQLQVYCSEKPDDRLLTETIATLTDSGR